MCAPIWMRCFTPDGGLRWSGPGQPGAGQATYRYTWSFNPDGSEGVVFWYEKAHARYGYQWIHPVHEVLKWVGEGVPGPP